MCSTVRGMANNQPRKTHLYIDKQHLELNKKKFTKNQKICLTFSVKKNQSN